MSLNSEGVYPNHYKPLIFKGLFYYGKISMQILVYLRRRLGGKVQSTGYRREMAEKMG
jgi:hypothetical protein